MKHIEILEHLSVQQLAISCRMTTAWVDARVEAGHLQRPAESPGFDGANLLRARRLAHLERSFDADPELAALTVDLIEEVSRLRMMLRMLGSGSLGGSEEEGGQGAG